MVKAQVVTITPDGGVSGKRGLTGKATTRKPLAERLRARLKGDNSTGCHVFQGYKDSKGYGQIGLGGRYGKIVLAHRAAYELYVGAIPVGACVLHKCDNPPCCNPEHLFLGSVADNNADMREKGRASGNTTKGLDHHNCVTTPTMELKIKEASGSQRKLEKEFGVSRSVIKRVRGF